MTLRCKPGDMAIVTGLGRVTGARNLGKVVTVDRLLTAREYCLEKIEPMVGPVWWLKEGFFVWKNGPAKRAADYMLTPIRPLETPETQTTDEEIAA